MKELQALEIVLSPEKVPSKEHAEAIGVLQQRLEMLRECELEHLKPYTHKVIGSQYHCPHEEQFKSLENAIASAFWAVEDNHYLPKQVTDMEGNVLLDTAALQEAMQRYDNRGKEQTP